MILLVMTVGTLAPPIGLNLFTMKGMAPDIPMSAIYKGAFPFVAATVVVILIVYFFPPLAIWLPNLL